MKGLLSGSFWGLLVGGSAVTIASLGGPQPAGNTPPIPPQVVAPEDAVAALPEETQGADIVSEIGEGEGPAPENPAPIVAAEPESLPEPETEAPAMPQVAAVETELSAPGDDAAPVAPQAEAESTSLGAAPQVTAPLSEPVAPVSDTAPIPAPETLAITEALDAPEPSETPGLSASAEDPVLPNPQSIAPQVPAAEDDLVVSTLPATPPKEDPVVVVEPPEAPETLEPEMAATNSAPVTPAEPEAQDVPEDQPAQEAGAADIAEAAPEAPPETVPEADEDGPSQDTEIADSAPEAAPEAPPTEAAPPVVVRIIGQDDGPRLPGGNSGVSIRRPGTDAVEPEEAVAPAEEPGIDPDAPPLTRYAAAFDNPEGKPVMSLILLDDGSLSGGPGLVAELPFPVTVVLPAGQAGAAERMAAYREAGIEVGVQANVPQEALPTDVEVALEAAFADLPETVVMVDPGNGGLQSSRAVTQQALLSLADRGRGVVVAPQGLNTATQLAGSIGVPAAVIYRDLDDQGQDARVIRRFLDQAAFRARQESGVVLLGRVRPDTISALMLWGSGDRAGQVAMAPVSALLSQDGPAN